MLHKPPGLSLFLSILLGRLIGRFYFIGVGSARVVAATILAIRS